MGLLHFGFMWILINFPTCCYTMSSCPTAILWARRAAEKCDNKCYYHCLYDAFNSNATYVIHQEKCITKPKKYKGIRFVLSGNLNAVDCQSDRYTPEATWSNTLAGSECPFKKSQCREEGQIIVDNGTSKKDRSCRCNYKQGYDYVIKPLDPCKCNPFQEDCSCYIRRCSRRIEILSQDYSCVEKQFLTIGQFVCSQITDQLDNSNITNVFAETEADSYEGRSDGKYNPACYVILILFVLMLPGIITHLLVRMIPKKMRMHQEIYTEPMNVVPYYQETKQLKEIERVLRQNRERLVVLKGMSGSGKTQAVNKFCERYRMMYSIVTKLSPCYGSSLKQSLLELLEDKLKWQCTSNDRGISFAAVVENFQNFLNHGDRKHLPFMLVVDSESESVNVSELTQVVSLIKKVPKLQIILTLTSGDHLANLQSLPYVLVEFNGMDKDEYTGLFNQLVPGRNDDDLKILVDAIGNIPLILATVLKYISINGSIKSYLEKYILNPKQMMHAISNRTDDFHSKNKPVLKSLMLHLEHIKDQGQDNYLWEVMNLIPLLEYDAVSPVVLHACYRHLSNNTHGEKKTRIDQLMQELSKFSLCQIVKANRHRIRRKMGQTSKSEGIMYVFHKVTMNVIEIMEDSSNQKNLKLDILLKLFCYEIDIDARSDLTVARNLLFVPHAKKLVSVINNEWDGDISPEQIFLIAYLYCAIGSTLLFERTNVKNAHIFLMKARHFALAVIGKKSHATEDKCLRQDSPGHASKKVTYDDIESTSQAILSFKFENDFIRDFILKKRRNLNDVACIKSAIKEKKNDNNFKMMSICKYHYLTEDEYTQLIQLGLALPIEDISKVLFAELNLRILHNNTRALHNLPHVNLFAKDEEKKQRLLSGIETEIEISRDFCNSLKKRLRKIFERKIKLFICLESDSSGQLLMYKYSRKSSDLALNDKIGYFEKKLARQNTECFDFGVIKMTSTENTNIRYNSICRRNLLTLFQKQMKQEQTDDGKRAIYAQGKVTVDKLMNQIHQMEEKNVNYTWLSLPQLYIQCGKFLLQSEDCEDTEQALTCFEEALEIEMSRNVFWTRFIHKGYKGKICCLRKLNRDSEVKEVTREVKESLRGQNRDEILEDILQENLLTC